MLVRTSTRRVAICFGAAAAATLLAGIVQMSGVPTAHIGVPLLMITFVLLLATAVMLAIDVVRRMLSATPADRPQGADPAVSAVLAARARRDEARRIAVRDPLMARELHVGRPDLPTLYDDGGLVDLNECPAIVIARTCGIELALANQITLARDTVGGLGTVDEVFALVDVPISLWDRIRDRAVVITS